MIYAHVLHRKLLVLLQEVNVGITSGGVGFNLGSVGFTSEDAGLTSRDIGLMLHLYTAPFPVTHTLTQGPALGLK